MTPKFVGGEKKDSALTRIHRLELNMNSAFNPPRESNTCSVPQPWGGKCGLHSMIMFSGLSSVLNHNSERFFAAIQNTYSPVMGGTNHPIIRLP